MFGSAGRNLTELLGGNLDGGRRRNGNLERSLRSSSCRSSTVRILSSCLSMQLPLSPVSSPRSSLPLSRDVLTGSSRCGVHIRSPSRDALPGSSTLLLGLNGGDIARRGIGGKEELGAESDEGCGYGEPHATNPQP